MRVLGCVQIRTRYDMVLEADVRSPPTASCINLNYSMGILIIVYNLDYSIGSLIIV